MNAHVSFISLGVRDLDRAKRFYGEGLGWPIHQDADGWVAFAPSEGSSAIGLYPIEALAGDAGVEVNDDGLHGITFSYLVGSDERVNEVLAEAERAGARIVRPAERAAWGGYGGHFADPEGFLWKVVMATDGQPLAE